MANPALLDGVYVARRASQLSGVPLSTVHSWARTGLVVPSVSPVREKLWSYADLLALRVVSWLRHGKQHEGQEYFRSSMQQVRRAFDELAAGRRDLFATRDATRRCVLLAKPDGKIAVGENATVREVGSSRLLSTAFLDVLAEYRVEGDAVGPDLVVPRPHLRIIPGKLAGEPHLADSRIATAVISALAAEGYGKEQLTELYPQASSVALDEAIEFERALAA